MTKTNGRYLMKARLNRTQRAYVEKVREIVGGSRITDRELILMAIDFFGKALAEEVKRQQEEQEAAKHKEIMELDDEQQGDTTAEQNTEGDSEDMADTEEVQDSSS